MHVLAMCIAARDTRGATCVLHHHYMQPTVNSTFPPAQVRVFRFAGIRWCFRALHRVDHSCGHMLLATSHVGVTAWIMV